MAGSAPVERKVIMVTKRLSILLLLAAAACGPTPEQREQLEQVQQIPVLTSERDSLLLQVADNARLMSEISAEIVKVQAAGTSGAQEGPMSREAVLENIRGLTARLEQSEARLVETQRRLQASGNESVELRRTVQDLQSTITNQRETITSLTDQMSQVRAENVQLTTEVSDLSQRTVALAEENLNLTTRVNTVYYVVGTKDDLIQRGIVTEEGGSRVLFVFGKAGKTLVPGRNLSPADFTAVDMRELVEIPLPMPDREYQIVSRQDLTALATQPDEEGRFQGAIQIAEPDRFWEKARFLIIVER
jgi:hypothetical protein